MILMIKIMLSILAVCTVVIIRCAFEDEQVNRDEDDEKSCDVTTDNSTDYRTHLMGRFLDRK